MRFIYETTGSPTLASLFTDIIAVLTGETDKNNLTCPEINLANTSIVANTPAGWELYDSDTGVANEAVLRAPTIDDPTQYKYISLRLDTYSSVYYRLNYTIMEDWNPSTNTATNETTNKSVNLMRASQVTYGIQPMLFLATPQYIFMSPMVPGTSGINLSQFMIMEIDRVHPCLRIGTGRVPAVTMLTWYTNTNSSNEVVRIPRFIDDAGSSDNTDVELFAFVSSTPHCFYSASPGLSAMGLLSKDRATDKDGEVTYGAYFMLFEKNSLYGHMAGTSGVAKIWVMMSDDTLAGPLNDELVYLKDEGMMRVRHCKPDVVGDGSPRLLFKVEHE